MLQNPCKTLGFKKNMVYKIPPGGGGGKPYPASGLFTVRNYICKIWVNFYLLHKKNSFFKVLFATNDSLWLLLRS